MPIRHLMAFVHIEKAAGTTLTSILQYNYLFRHCDVKTLLKNDKGVFSSESLKIIQQINPFVRSISGHSIAPYSDLAVTVPNIRYITILREPIARYISHYQYWVDRKGSNYTFQDFLDDDLTHNFQTRKIAGAPDLERAIKILDSFFLVGVLEEFNRFLEILQKKILPKKFDIFYVPMNVAKKNRIRDSIQKRMDDYIAKITQRNLLDIELYNYAKNTIFKNEKMKYLGSSTGTNLTYNMKHSQVIKLRIIMYKIYAKAYYAQLLKLYRIKNGLPKYGSY